MILGLDVGGTKTAVLLGDESGNVVRREEYPSGAQRGFTPMFADICARAAGFSGYDCIGVSIGGPVDALRGRVQGPPNLPGWDDVPLKDLLEDQLGKPCYVEHDAKAGALAEWMFGAGRGTQDMVFLTLGTGLGAGVICGGRLVRGAANCAGEVGHWRIHEDGPEVYGKRGSWEGYSSGTGLAALSGLRHGLELSAAQLAGSPAEDVIAEGGRALGRGLALLVDLLAPETIVLGSLARRLGPAFLDPALQTLKEEALPALHSRCRIQLSQLGEKIGDVAALCAAIYGGGLHAKTT